MPVQTAVWKIGSSPERLSAASLTSEKQLEDMIVAAPGLLSDEWMLIGRQEGTGYGGIIDLLAIAPDGSLVLIELKRARTPREIVAQALDYAGWVEKLRPEEVAAIYGRFAPGRSLDDDFRQRFHCQLDEESLNASHQIVIVAGSLDDSTERIVAYLGERDIPINVLCFQVFNCGADKLLSRTWLLDPVKVIVEPLDGREPWNGEFYCSFGHSETRSWEDAREYGFICGGGGTFYSKTLQMLAPGDRVWVRVPKAGFVGVGKVTGHSQRAADFLVERPTGKIPVIEVAKKGHYHREFLEDPERCEYFVPVRWLATVPLENAVHEIGLFGNQNTICRPTTPKWQSTVERLKKVFPDYNK